jgi:hypothetical protein
MKRFVPDFSDVKGMHKPVMEIARAAMAGERIMLVSHGFGASMIASRLNGLRPEMSGIQKAMVAENFRGANLHAPKGRPFRAPHASTSSAGILGTNGRPGEILGTNGRPGEVHLARHGTLLLNNVLEFTNAVKCTLAMNMDDSTLLVVTTPKCPCGSVFRNKKCFCAEGIKRSYFARLDSIVNKFEILDSIVNKFEITTVVDIPYMSNHEKLQAKANPSTADLRAMLQADPCKTPTTLV